MPKIVCIRDLEIQDSRDIGLGCDIIDSPFKYLYISYYRHEDEWFIATTARKYSLDEAQEYLKELGQAIIVTALLNHYNKTGKTNFDNDNPGTVVPEGFTEVRADALAAGDKFKLYDSGFLCEVTGIKDFGIFYITLEDQHGANGVIKKIGTTAYVSPYFKVLKRIT